MTLKDVLYVVSDMAQALRGVKELNIDTFNRYVQLANNDLKRTVFGYPEEKTGYENREQISDDLLPFRASSTLAVTSGNIALPTDYWHKVSLEIAAPTTYLGYPFEFVTAEEFAERKSNSVTLPTSQYPIANIRPVGASKFISIYPTSITSVNFHYLKTDTPILRLKTENAVQVYDTASTELLWSQDKYIDIIRIILGYLNIPVSSQEVLAYTEAKTTKTN
jgi:hypothetical protein